ncbi:MAG: hypothetical protein RI983_791 [Bacteroidota bacterium]
MFFLMKYRLFFITLTLFVNVSLVLGQPYDSDTRWRVIDSPLVFPSNFNDWMLRNLDLPNKMVAGRAFGEILLTDQTNHFLDFNGDGKKDIALEILFDSYMSDTIRQARQRFYKGIFLANSDGKYHLDTNFIISGRGYEEGGEFGDFNGDGLIDYANTIANYHGDPNLKPLDLYKYGNDLSPSIVFLNNGKGFNSIYLDTTLMGVSSIIVSDIDNDKKDEIFVMINEKYVVYKYNSATKRFDRNILKINTELDKLFGRTINFVSTPKINNSSIMSIIAYNNCFSPPCKNNNTSDLAVVKVDLLNDRFEILDSMVQAFYVWPDGQISTQGLFSGNHYKYIDLDKQQPDEFIVLGGFGRMLNRGATFYGERMGITVFNGNNNVTDSYYEKDTLDYMTKGLFGVVANDVAIFPNNGLSRSIQIDSATREKYKYSYYRFHNGKFRRRQMQFNRKNLKLSSMSTEIFNYIHDFDNDNLSDVLLADSYDMRNAKMFLQVYCPNSINKPIFNTNSYSFCSSDSLKLTVTNANKGDTLKWYYGNNIDLSSSDTKSFFENTKLYVTKVDSIGCSSTSDTIQIVKIDKPVKPTISWNGSELSVPSTYSGYKWLLNNTVISGASSFQFKPINTGQYQVVVTNALGCSDTSQVYNLVVTSVNNTTALQNSITLFPNPANDQVVVDLGVNPSKPVNVQLYDGNGRLLTSWVFTQRQKQLDISKYSKGIYWLHVITSKGKVTKYFIK